MEICHFKRLNSILRNPENFQIKKFKNGPLHFVLEISYRTPFFVVKRGQFKDHPDSSNRRTIPGSEKDRIKYGFNWSE